MSHGIEMTADVEDAHRLAAKRGLSDADLSQEDYEARALASYAQLDIRGTQKLSLVACFMAANLSMPECRFVEGTVFDEVVQDFTGEHFLSPDDFRTILGRIGERRGSKADRKSHGSSTYFFYTFAHLMTLPFWMFFSYPGWEILPRVGTIVRSLMTASAMPHRLRRVALRSKLAYAALHFCISFIWVCVLVAAVLAVHTQNKPSTGPVRTALTESTIPACMFVLALAYVSMTASLTDISGTRDLLLMVKDVPFEELPVILENQKTIKDVVAAGGAGGGGDEYKHGGDGGGGGNRYDYEENERFNKSIADRSSNALAGGPFRPRHAMDMIALTLDESDKQRKQISLLLRIINVAVFLIAGIFVLIPTFLRAAWGWHILGRCSDFSPRNCRDLNNIFEFQVVEGIIAGTIMVSWWLARLTEAYTYFVERVRWFSRMGKMLTSPPPRAANTDTLDADLDGDLDQDADSGAEPQEKATLHLPMRHPDNIVAWSRVRRAIFAVRPAAGRKIEIALGCIIFLFLMLVALAVYESVVTFRSRINQQTIVLQTTVAAILLGIFLTQPTLTLGVFLNVQQDNWNAFWLKTKWRTAVLVESLRRRGLNAAADYHQRARDLSDALQAHMVDVPTTVKVLGVSLTTTFLYSVGSTAAAAVASWVISVLQEGD